MNPKVEKGKPGILVSFDICSERFENNYERNKFYRGLYGWKQKIKNKNKEYEYERKGLLDRIPYIKVGDSVFIIALKELEKIMKYFEKWDDKINYKTYKVLLDKEKSEKLKKWKEIEIK